jgi:hypothetical protein
MTSGSGFDQTMTREGERRKRQANKRTNSRIVNANLLLVHSDNEGFEPATIAFLAH